MDVPRTGHRHEKGSAAHPSRRKRFLIVSDSVGSPIHARGSYHYTINLMRALQRCGHEVCLLVEQPPGYRIQRRRETRLTARPEAPGHDERLAKVYEYLWPADHDGNYPARIRLQRLVTSLYLLYLALPLLSPLGVKLLRRRRAILRQDALPNRPQELDFVPSRLDHLRTCSELVLCDAAYSLSLSACHLGLGAPTIDARGFDVVLVDTPSFFRFDVSPGAETVAVIHDLIPLTDPIMRGFSCRLFSRRITETLAGADSLIFVSDSTRREFCETFPSSAATIATVLHPSVADDIADEAGFHASAENPRTGVMGANGPDADYMISIVSDEPRKNIANLLSAWALLPAGIGLKLVGYVDPERYGLSRPDGTPSRVEVLGYVDEATKKRLLTGAVGLVMPSYCEGFGIPLVEASFFGKPVFCSDLPVFHEVMGENAIYFEPSSPESIADAIRTYLDDPAAVREQIRGGREECRRRFSLTALTECVADRFGDASSQPL